VDNYFLNKVFPVLGIAAIGIGDLINDPFVLLDQRRKLIVGKRRKQVFQEFSFVALLFAGSAQKITTLGKFSKSLVGALRPLPHSVRYRAVES